jgi:hypothetical protein
MERKATYRLKITRRETLYVGDVPDHSLMLTEMEGEPVEYAVGLAGEFVSRRSVTFHDRIRGTGPVQGYAITSFQHGAVYSSFNGHRDGQTRLTTGTWKTYKGTGTLSGIKGQGNFTVKPADEPREFIIEIQGEYEL